MTFGAYESPKLTPVPTFFQYLKTASKGIESKTKFPVELIWLPGKFNNVTLQTHAFRYICDENHPLYQEIKEYSLELVSRGNVDRLEIVITSISERTIEVLENPKKKVEWRELGKNALKMKEP